MMNYVDYVKQNAGTLTIFDVDETLFNTHSKIYVTDKKGNIIKKLGNGEFNTYKLAPDEQFDFREFRSADIFSSTSTPIASMVKKLRAIQRNVMKTPLSRTIIVTARSDFDSKKKVVQFFQSHGIDVDNQVYIERSGNLGSGSTSGNKKQVFTHYLDCGVYKKVRLYDDAIGNLQALLSLKPKYPGVTFEAWLVNGHTGEVTRFKG